MDEQPKFKQGYEDFDKDKMRGFEKISKDQLEKDFNEIIFINKYGENAYLKLKEEIINREYKNITLPKRATAKSAGYDIYSPIEFYLEPNEEIKLPTGIKSYMQSNEVLFAYPRSSLGFKYYCRLANTIGVIDSDYYNNEDNEGHIWIKIRNESDKIMQIEEGEAICQMIFQKYLLSDGDNFEGNKREGGIGSTNK